jgi:phosphate/sulfate permease
MFGLTTALGTFLIISIVLVIFFEFINGFHDTANAVATVIYTNSMKPTIAVVFSGIMNFIGVFLGGIGVAMGIVNLLPIEIMVDPDIWHSVSMILAILLTSIIWNFGTWYVGLPASSSHTLIGSILGIGLAFYFITGKDAVNWGKAQEIGLALFISPLFGFAAAIVMMYIFKRLIKNETIYKEPIPGKKPPLWIRGILIASCGLVSSAHGSNDGQKGIGMLMLVLIVFLPKTYIINPNTDLDQLKASAFVINEKLTLVDTTRLARKPDLDWFKAVQRANIEINSITTKSKTLSNLNDDERFALRTDVIIIAKNFEKLNEQGNLSLTSKESRVVKENIDRLKTANEYAPDWVKIVISIALGLGTMVGWKRIVQTVGEKIGKQHMSYAQGAAAQIIASSTISLSTQLHLPVSTTHVLSSGIAGTMVAKKGLKNLQKKTIRNILLAWVLTLPITIILSGGLFLLFRAIL